MLARYINPRHRFFDNRQEVLHEDSFVVSSVRRRDVRRAVRGRRRRRRAHLQLAPWKALGDDLLPALDSFGTITYRKLWEK